MVSSNYCKLQLLLSNEDAFEKRFLGISKAHKEISALYYLWEEDDFGLSLLAEMIQVAERKNLKVRLLLDGFSFFGRKSIFYEVAKHPLFEIKLFNPLWFNCSSFHQIFEIAAQFVRLNKRMHNKLWIIDELEAICGGRNIGSKYLCSNEESAFADMDLYLQGDILKDCKTAFETYWNCRYAKRLTPTGLLKKNLVSEIKSKVKSRFPNLSEKPVENTKIFALNQNQIELVVDSPHKLLLESLTKSKRTFATILSLLRNAQSRITIISPYFVPGRNGKWILFRNLKRKLKIEVLTNSYSATDAIGAYLGYLKYRYRLLKKGILLWELKPVGQFKKKRGFLPRSRASLHAKMVLIDNEQLFIGSYNFDPRSARLNSEMGFRIRCPEMARLLEESFHEATHPGNSWKVIRIQRKLKWVDESNGQPVYLDEPNLSWFQRFLFKLLSRLPIDGYV